ncbi:hypothetical protein GCM10023183_13530 [Nibribacter koreensis]|uniref:Uncharacterized protein n=1 Tax=Nibribacter koreensis TaxID=1084519 RepID=A0ABP8FEL3_9BACT
MTVGAAPCVSWVAVPAEAELSLEAEVLAVGWQLARTKPKTAVRKMEYVIIISLTNTDSYL